MNKLTIGSIIAGIVVTLWGIFAWMVLDFHKETFKNCTDEKTLSIMMLVNMPEHAVYIIPARPKTHDEESVAEYKKKVESGPHAVIFFLPAGVSLTMTNEIIYGTLLNILTAMLAGWFLQRSTAVTQGFVHRVAFISLLAVFASLTIHFQNFNWMYFPIKYTAAMSADLIIGWILGGAVIAAFIKEKKYEEKL